jgi:putative membrane protein
MNTTVKNSTRRWIFVPVLTAVALIAILIGVSAYLYRSASVVTGFFPWYGGSPFGWFFFIPVIFLVFFAFRWFFWGGNGWGHWGYYGQYSDSAMEILRQRFARGEITKNQFDQMARDLEQH